MHTQKKSYFRMKRVDFRYGYTVALKIAHAHLTAPCFIKVISQASKPDGIYLRGFSLGCPDKCRIIEGIVIKLYATWPFLICFLFPL